MPVLLPYRTQAIALRPPKATASVWQRGPVLGRNGLPDFRILLVPRLGSRLLGRLPRRGAIAQGACRSGVAVGAAACAPCCSRFRGLLLLPLLAQPLLGR